MTIFEYNTMKILFCHLYLLTTLITCINGQFQSPCPDVFQYIIGESNADSWTGEVTINAPDELRGVWMRIIFDNTPKDVTVSNV